MEIMQTGFDYSNLEIEARILVQQHTSEIRSLMRRTTYDAIEIGQKLLEVKIQLGHGNFIDWLKGEFAWSERTARNYMIVAEKFATVADLDLIAPSALYLLAGSSTPEEAKREAFETIAQGHTVTKDDAKSIIEKHKSLTPGQAVTVQTGEFQGQTVTIVESEGAIVQCEMDGGVVSLLTSELIVPEAPRPQVEKPSQVSELIAQLELKLAIANARISKLEALLNRAKPFVSDALKAAIDSLF